MNSNWKQNKAGNNQSSNPSPQVGRIKDARRRYRTKKELAALFGEQCYWCRRQLPLTQLTIDHLIPISKGGSNAFENLRLACKPCNQKRGNSLFPPQSGENVA